MSAESPGVLSGPQVSTPSSPSGLPGERASVPLRCPINELTELRQELCLGSNVLCELGAVLEVMGAGREGVRGEWLKPFLWRTVSTRDFRPSSTSG